MVELDEDETAAWLERHDGDTDGLLSDKSENESDIAALQSSGFSLRPAHLVFRAPGRGASAIQNGIRYDTGDATPLGYQANRGRLHGSSVVTYRNGSTLFKHELKEDWDNPREAGNLFGILFGLLAAVGFGATAAALAGPWAMLWGLSVGSVGATSGFKAAKDTYHWLQCEKKHRFKPLSGSVPDVLDSCEILSKDGTRLAESFLKNQKLHKSVTVYRGGRPVSYVTARTDKGCYVLTKKPLNVTFDKLSEQGFREWIGRRDLDELYEFYFGPVREA